MWLRLFALIAKLFCCQCCWRADKVSTSCLLYLRSSARVQCVADSTLRWQKWSPQELLCKSSVSSGQLLAHCAAWALHLFASLLARGKYLALKWDKQLQGSGGKHIFQEFLVRWNTWNTFFFFFVKSLLCSALQLGDPAVSYTQQMGNCLELGTEAWKIFFVFKSVPNQISTHSVRTKNIEQRGGIFHIGRNERQWFDSPA